MTARGAVQWALRFVVVIGLAIDAYTHADLAGVYSAIGHTITQGTLFAIEAVVSALTAGLLLLRPRRWTLLLAVVVAGSALGAILLYRYVNVGPLGPLPNMYEPVWYPEKAAAAAAEVAALLAALLAYATSLPAGWFRGRQVGDPRGPAPSRSAPSSSGGTA